MLPARRATLRAVYVCRLGQGNRSKNSRGIAAFTALLKMVTEPNQRFHGSGRTEGSQQRSLFQYSHILKEILCSLTSPMHYQCKPNTIKPVGLESDLVCKSQTNNENQSRHLGQETLANWSRLWAGDDPLQQRYLFTWLTLPNTAVSWRVCCLPCAS